MCPGKPKVFTIWPLQKWFDKTKLENTNQTMKIKEGENG